jgi:hypothetical protein
MDTTTALGSTVYIILFLLGIVLVIGWIVLPFAIIGTKPILRDLLREQRRTNELLESRFRAVDGARSDREQR